MGTSPIEGVETLVLPDYLDLVDAARIVKLHPQSLRRLVKAGIVPGVHFWQGKYVFHVPALRQFASAYDPRPGPKQPRRLL